jgi:dipeptidyl aminopeptidase/acylaminoacyl peptidase
VREVVMPTYAAAFAAAGLNALVFDYRNLGVSDGDNRQHLDPWAQIRDYQNAISFLERHEAVDPHRIGVWGISYSGGHALVLAATDPRVRSIVSQVPVVDGFENMRRAHGTMEFRRLWAMILEDRNLRYEKPGQRLYLPTLLSIRKRRSRLGRSQRPYAPFSPLRRAKRRCTRTGARSNLSIS